MLTSWILVHLWRRGSWREYPFFAAFTLVRLLRSVVLFPLFVAVGLDAYSRMYWLIDPLFLAAFVLPAAELWKARKWGTAAAAIVFLTQCLLVISRNNRAMDVDFWVMLVVACSVVPLVYKNLIALGLFIAAFGIGMPMRGLFLWNAADSRFLPSYVFLLANVLWTIGVHRVTEDTVVPFAD